MSKTDLHDTKIINETESEISENDQPDAESKLKSSYLCLSDKFTLGHKLRSIGTQGHILGVSKCLQTTSQNCRKSSQYNYQPESCSVGINIKPESRHAWSQTSGTVPGPTPVNPNRITVFSSKHFWIMVPLLNLLLNWKHANKQVILLL